MSRLDEFLSMDGAVELLCEIDLLGSPYSEINANLTVSKGQLSNLMEEATGLGLIESAEDDEGNSVWVLTPDSAPLRYQLEEMNTVSEYDAYSHHYHQFHEKREQFTEWAVDNPPSNNPDRENRFLLSAMQMKEKEGEDALDLPEEDDTEHSETEDTPDDESVENEGEDGDEDE